MNNNTPEVLDGLLAQMLRRGLPVDYAQRAVAELADHHQDLIEELRAAGQGEPQALAEADRRLGEPRVLISKTVREYQRRYWCGRWPLLTFLLGPIPLLVITWVVASLACLSIVWPLERLGFLGPYQCDGVLSASERGQVYFMQGYYLCVVPAVVAFYFARLAKRAALSWAWVVVAAGVLAMLMVGFECGIPDPVPTMMNADGTTLPADKYFCRMGLPESWNDLWLWFGINHIPCLLPLGIGGLMVWRMKQLSQWEARLAVGDC